MLRRTWFLARARFAMAGRSGWPIPALLFHAVLGSLLALLVRDALPAFPFALLALSVGMLLLALPILSDLGAILRHDEAQEWAGALPVRAGELMLARTVHLVVLLAGLVGAWFTPWAFLAPGEMGLGARLALPLLGFALALSTATVLIWVQQLLLGRFQSGFVLFETALVVLIVIALVQLLGNLPELAELDPDEPWSTWFPPAWFARPLVAGGWSALLPMGAAILCLGALLRVPVSAASPTRRRDWIERILEPLRRLGTRAWVRPEERGAFDLVYSALPREREVALRTYPMLGIPLAFLWISASSADAVDRSWSGDVLTLLLFTVAVYLPLLLVHVPLSESHQAAWLLRTAPCAENAIVEGAIKALFVRWLVPLYLGLLALGWFLAEGALLARLWLPAVLLALLLLRVLYRRCVHDLPLSRMPEELSGNVDWAGTVAGLAVGMTVLAVVANRFLTWEMGTAAAAVLVLVELACERRQHRSHLARRS